MKKLTKEILTITVPLLSEIERIIIIKHITYYYSTRSFVRVIYTLVISVNIFYM